MRQAAKLTTGAACSCLRPNAHFDINWFVGVAWPQDITRERRECSIRVYIWGMAADASECFACALAINDVHNLVIYLKI